MMETIGNRNKYRLNERAYLARAVSQCHMKIAFVALIGYAAASAILSPVVYGANAGDVQAAAIDATVAAQDTARSIGEGQVRAAELINEHNTEAVRQITGASRDVHENAYWSGLAAVQSQTAAIDGAAAAVRGAHLAGPYVAAPYAAVPYGIAGPLGIASPYAAYGAYGLGLRAW
ncbi:unnamed protein product [Leptidea sinapis]|uniref:Cuticle protein 1 n=1 Tax=Leptidea sinapis TaxID=189913 RepID=A0A5E4Q0T0_9NEOP|nr:unnamed protein product [Leptidea sinapis]